MPFIGSFEEFLERFDLGALVKPVPDFALWALELPLAEVPVIATGAPVRLGVPVRLDVNKFFDREQTPATVSRVKGISGANDPRLFQFVRF